MSKREFRLSIAPSDVQLRAIGSVVVNWSLLEGLIWTTAQQLTESNAEAWGEFQGLPSFKRRLAFCRNQVMEQVKEPEAGHLAALLDRVGEMQAARDKIVHGMWATDVKGENLEEARAVFSFMGPKRPFEWQLSYPKIMDIARKIDAINADLMEFMIVHSATAEHRTLGAALKNVLK